MDDARFADVGGGYNAAYSTPRAGWEIDKDHWHRRRVRAADPFKPADFGNSCHAFIEKGWLYCRDAWQAKDLDEGRMV